MCAKKISLNESEFELAVGSLEANLKTLQDILLKMSEGTSESEAMNEFRKRANAASFLVAKYTGQLCRDIESLRKAVDSLQLTDKQIGKSLSGSGSGSKAKSPSSEIERQISSGGASSAGAGVR